MYSALAASRASWASACASSALSRTIVASACASSASKGRRSRLKSTCPCLTRSPSRNDSCSSTPVTCGRLEITAKASTLPMAARSTGTSFDTALAVTTGAAPVVTAKAVSKDVPVDLAAIGNVEAFAVISNRPQVTGVLEQLSFREGDLVKQGQVLFSLDRRPFEALLAQADATMVRDKALLAQAEAQLARDAANAEYMQLASERQQQLTSRGIISKDVSEQARSQADATAALV